LLGLSGCIGSIEVNRSLQPGNGAQPNISREAHSLYPSYCGLEIPLNDAEHLCPCFARVER